MFIFVKQKIKNMANIAKIDLNNQDNSFKELLNYEYLNLTLDNKDNFFIRKDYALELTTNFVRKLVKEGKLIPKEGYIVDDVEEAQAEEAKNFVKNIFGE